MKERNLLYFLLAIIVSTMFIVSIIVRLLNWYHMYGTIVTPRIHVLIIPLLIIWVGWYFENKGLLLSSSILLSVILFMHMGNSGLLSGNPYVISSLTPIVKTIYVVSFMMISASIGLGFYTYLSLDLKKS
jgi:hypothetical protein